MLTVRIRGDDSVDLRELGKRVRDPRLQRRSLASIGFMAQDVNTGLTRDFIENTCVLRTAAVVYDNDMGKFAGQSRIRLPAGAGEGLYAGIMTATSAAEMAGLAECIYMPAAVD